MSNKPTKPKGVKVPQDHQPPADPTAPTSFDIEVRGIEFTLSEEVLNDFELMTDLGRVDDGDVTRLGTSLRRLVGENHFRALMDTCRDPKTGRVTLEAGSEVVMEIFEKLQELAGPNS